MINIDYSIGVTVIAFVVIAYCVMGGIKSVAITDFIQMVLILGGFFLAIPFAIRLCCNFPTALKNIPYESLNLFKGISPATIISLIIMYVATFTVGQEVTSSIYSIRHAHDATKALILSAFLIILFAFLPTFLGLISLSMAEIGYVDTSFMFQDGARYAFLNLVVNTMPPLIVSLVFVGILSAIMSSADSDILAAGTIFSNDIYKIHIDKGADDDQVVKITRLTIIMFGIIAYLLALFNSGSIIIVLIFVFSLRAAGAFIPYVFGLYWSKSSAAGTIASLTFGCGSFIVLEIYKISVLGLQSIIISLIVSLFCFIIFSKLFPPVINSLELADD